MPYRSIKRLQALALNVKYCAREIWTPFAANPSWVADTLQTVGRVA
tara:strand:- start:703 stop:840 length:138 start_codon:yes stop_codon:yes gene_type:complete